MLLTLRIATQMMRPGRNLWIVVRGDSGLWIGVAAMRGTRLLAVKRTFDELEPVFDGSVQGRADDTPKAS